MTYLIYLLVFPIVLVLLLLAEVGNAIGDNASFWAIVLLIATFITDMIRRSIQRKWDKQDNENKAADLKSAIILAESQVQTAADAIARKVHDEAELVKEELEFYHQKQELVAKNETEEIVDKLESQGKRVEEIDEKVVTLQVADHHKNEVIEAVKENTKRTVENTAKTIEGINEAHAAFEIANTINNKLEAQQKAGLADQDEERNKHNLKEIEDIEKGR